MTWKGIEGIHVVLFLVIEEKPNVRLDGLGHPRYAGRDLVEHS